MKRSLVLITFACTILCLGCAGNDEKCLTLSATVTLEPGQSATLISKNGVISIEGVRKSQYQSVLNKAPAWMKIDLELALSKLSKAPDRVGKDTFLASARIDGKEDLIFSATGVKPVVLELPDYKDISSILPQSLDKTARIAIADINSDNVPDLVVCPTNGGYYFLLGPSFKTSTKQGNVAVNQKTLASQFFPVCTISGLVELCPRPKGFSFFDSKNTLVKCDQGNFISALPNAYGAMTSLGVFFIDSYGDLRLIDRRLTGIEKAIPTGYSSKSEPAFPSFNSQVHIAFDKKRILVAKTDGELLGFDISKGEWKKTIIDTDIIFGKSLSVQVFEGDLYFRDSSTDMIRVAKGTGWQKLENTNVYSDSPFAVADLNKDGYADLAVINKNKLSILEGPYFDKYIKVIDDSVEKQTTDGNTESVPAITEDCSPAFGDINDDGQIDLLVGRANGGIDTYLAPDFVNSDSFKFVNVGDHASPQFGDVDDDGNAELIVANENGKLFCYKRDNEGWHEWRSWSFIPSTSCKTIDGYYNSYMTDASLVQWKDDPQTINAYVSQLEHCDPKILDEIAFVIANTSPEILRAIARMGQADILTRNAKTIYNYAPLLPYVKIVEKNDYTTIIYKIAGKEVELPRDDYYWYVVHPRIFFELPVGINCSWWDRSAKDYGMSNEQWWLHQENYFQGKLIFWRETYKEDKTYGKSVIDAASSSQNYEEAVANIYKLKEVGKNKPFTYGYLTNDLYPWEIYKKHYGSCGENSIVFTSMARAALIPCYTVINQGEDHQWNEVWMPDGWTHLEPNAEKLTWDDPGISSEGEDHRKKDISAVLGWRGDDYAFPTTTTVHNNQTGYTVRHSGYTDTAAVTIKIVDSENKPVESGLVIVRTGWMDCRNVTILGYTNSQGTTHFDLGHQSYYLIDVATPYGMTGIARLVVDELKKYEITLQVPGKSNYTKPVYSQSENTEGEITVETIQDELRPINFKTGRSNPLGGYLLDKYSYRGPLFYRQPVDATPVTLKIASNMFEAGVGSSFRLSPDQTLTITNDSLYTYKTVRINFQVQKSKTSSFKL